MAINIEDHKAVLASDAIIFKDGKILLVKRKNEPHGWALPGGLVDPHETFYEAMERETREEVGLVVNDAELFAIADKPYRDPRGRTISCSFLVHDWAGDPHASDDADDYAWFSLEKVQEYDEDGLIAFDHAEIIESVYRFVAHAYGEVWA